jgi:predicted Rossmann fold flavoprotein
MREDWAGIALRDCVLRGRQSKAFTQWRGDLLFTHRGISGPCCLGISREVSEHISKAPVTLEVDVVPDLSFEELTERFLAYARENPRRQVATWLEDFGPERFLEGMLKELDIPANMPMAQTPTKVRNRLLNGLKGFPLGAVREVILPKGEVVAGGVSLDEVNPQTMQSQFVSNLFLCGEILDIAGPVGGYNLQAAFATGFVAGESACELVRS